VTGTEAVGISGGAFLLSVALSTPFIVYAKLTKMFDDPGAFDYISFCVEDMSQFYQVIQ
jgi:hypothetical protein